MSRKQLICRNCGAKLTAALDPITTVERADVACNFECGDGESPVPRGQVLFVEGDVLRARQRAVKGWNPENAPEIWMHLSDVAPFVTITDDTKRLSGCCGPSGTGGPNRLCVCGVYVGTESSDCWTYHMFMSFAENTYWKDHD